MIEYNCAWCGDEVLLLEGQAPDDGLCPPCAELGPDWKEDPRDVELVNKARRSIH